MNFGIITDIQTPALSFHFGIAADQTLLQYDIKQICIGTDDGIFNDGMIDCGIIAYGNIGADNGIFDLAVLPDTHRRYEDDIIKTMFL